MVQFLSILIKITDMKKLILSFLLLLFLVALQAQENIKEILQDLEKNQPSSQDQPITATLKSSSRLFGDKDDLTTVILIIPAGDTVEVLDSDSTYLYVVYKENEGYIFKRQAVINEKSVNTTTQQQAEQVQQEEQQISRFTYLDNKYGTNIAARLNAGKIWKGMNSEMVRDSWGNPLKINRVIGNVDIKEEWIYRNTWLYIENNTLVDWGPIIK
jgi:hypothetical protein